MADLAQRRATLIAALGFARLSWQRHPPAATALHTWLDSWRGAGDVIGGLHRQGYDVQLTQYGDDAWRANIYTSGTVHSIVHGTGWEPTPWKASQQADGQALQAIPQPIDPLPVTA